MCAIDDRFATLAAQNEITACETEITVAVLPIFGAKRDVSSSLRIAELPLSQHRECKPAQSRCRFARCCRQYPQKPAARGSVRRYVRCRARRQCDFGVNGYFAPGPLNG
jgi:hypothetical protein